MNQIQRILVLFLIMLSFSSCEVVEGIFNVGVGVGIFIVLAIIAVILWIISRFRK